MVTLIPGAMLWGCQLATDPQIPYGRVLLTNDKRLVGSPATLEAFQAMPADELADLKADLEAAEMEFPD